mmetsp:Transcript_4752/g.10145  ORF Transcript_4752/g.10145 Transcript_4752/m.10145 type:complete len:449 (-) Transcript_4752:9-1355(-)
MIARFSLQGVDLRPRFNRRVDLRPRQDDGGCSGRGDRGEWHQDRRASERRGREDRSYQRGERDGDRRDEREVGRRRDDDRRGVERSSNAHDITRPRDFPNRERPPRRAQDDERSHQRDRVALGTGRRDNQDQQRSSHREDQGRIDDRSGRGRVENGHEQQEHAKLLAELQKSCRYEEDEIQRLKDETVRRRGNRDDVRTKLEAEGSRLTQLKRDADELEKRLGQITSSHQSQIEQHTRTRENTAAELRQAEQAHEDRIRELQQQKAQLANRVEELQDRRAHAEATIQGLTRSIAAEEVRVQEVQGELARQQRDRARSPKRSERPAREDRRLRSGRSGRSERRERSRSGRRGSGRRGASDMRRHIAVGAVVQYVGQPTKLPNDQVLDTSHHGVLLDLVQGFPYARRVRWTTMNGYCWNVDRDDLEEVAANAKQRRAASRMVGGVTGSQP